MDSSVRSELCRGACVFPPLLALFFVFLDLLKASRSSQWSGYGVDDLRGLAAGGAVYLLVMLVGTAVIAVLLAKLFRPKSSGFTPVIFGGLVAAGALWAALSYYREHRPTPDDAVVVAGLLGICCVVLARRFFGVSSFYACCAMLGTVLLAGLAALVAVGDFFLFQTQRAEATTFLPILWMALAALAGPVAWSGAGGWRFLRRGLHTVVVLGLPVALYASLNVMPLEAGVASRPNLVFIISDTLRSDYMSAYGGEVPTPNVSQLAADGTLFERSYSLAPWTMPSMTGLFSSTYPPGLTPGVDPGLWVNQLWQYEAPHAEESLAVKLRDAGYVTGAVTSNAFLPVVPGLMEGFDVRASAHPILLMRGGLFAHFPFLSDALGGVWPTLAPLKPHNTTEDMARYSGAFLRRYGRQPFYLWVHYIDPHAPYDPPEDYHTEPGPWPFFYPYVGGEQWGVPVLGKNFAVAETDRSFVQSLYEGEIRYVDDYVGRVMDTLGALGLDENTYVAFTSDHGEELWDHGMWGHGQSLHEELVRVPLIVAGPSVVSQRVDAPVSAIDLTPTLAGLMGVGPAASWRGESLGPVLRGEDVVAARPVFAQATSNKSWPHPQQMVVLGQYKLVRGSGEVVDGVMLYDLAADPGETVDVCGDAPGPCEEMQGLLLDWLDSFDSTFAAEDSGGDDALRDALGGMGYL